MPNVYLITGDDEGTIQEDARKLVAKLAGPDADEFSREVYKDGDDRQPQDVLGDFIGAILTPSFLGGQKVVWLQHFSAFDQEGAKSGAVPPALAILAERLAEGIPPDIIVVMDGPGAKDGKALVKTVQQIGGKVVHHKKPDVGKRGWEQDVRRLLEEQARGRNLTLTREMIAYLAEVIGTDSMRIPQELEKIFCYAGERPTLRDVKLLCVGTHEAVYFALNEAISRRNLGECLETIEQFMAHTRSPEGECIRLVRMLARHMRDVLHARLLLHALNATPASLGNAVKNLSPAQREANAGPLIDKSPWVIGKAADAAHLYSGPELVKAINYLAAADRALVSSGLPNRLILETLVTRIVMGDRAKVS